MIEPRKDMPGKTPVHVQVVLALGTWTAMGLFFGMMPFCSAPRTGPAPLW